MTTEQRKRMKHLIVYMNRASYAYYNKAPEIISNFEFDAMDVELRELEEETGFIYDCSPTQKTGSDYENQEYVDEVFEDEYDDEDIYEGIPKITSIEINDDAKRETHEYPALSLAKSKDVSVLQKWAGARPIWLSWKLDGLTLVVTYDDGKITKIMTRGNGVTGSNITYMKGYIEGIPEKISYKGHLVVRGEATISYSMFNAINDLIEDVEEQYANPRNLVSGTMGLDETRVKEVAERGVVFYAFTLVHLDEEMVSWGERMDYLEKMGFKVVDREATDASNLPSVIDKWTKIVTSGKMNVPVDGLVICYDDTDYAQTGSVTGHHATNAGFAFKWQDSAVESKLIDIEWSCGAASITPVAIFETVQIEGTDVSRASLCNISEMRRLGIGAKGTVLKVIKSNMIIPKVIEANSSGTTFEIPKTCPVCGAKTEVKMSAKSTTKTETLHCTNPKCTAKHIRKYSRFVSKTGMDIDGLSNKTIIKFINMKFIKSFADIYGIDKFKEEIVKMEGFGEKSYNNLIKAVNKSKKVSPINLIYALNIPLIGLDAGKKMVAKYGTKETFERIKKQLGFEEVDGIGPEKSNSIIDWYNDTENKTLLDNLLSILEVENVEVKEESGALKDLTFVVTGDLYTISRKDLTKYIEDNGGKVTGSVSKKTNYLINNDNTSTSSKNETAKKLGIPIITEEEFIKTFNKN